MTITAVTAHGFSRESQNFHILKSRPGKSEKVFASHLGKQDLFALIQLNTCHEVTANQHMI